VGEHGLYNLFGFFTNTARAVFSIFAPVFVKSPMTNDGFLTVNTTLTHPKIDFYVPPDIDIEIFTIDQQRRDRLSPGQPHPRCKEQRPDRTAPHHLRADGHSGPANRSCQPLHAGRHLV
jgi:hypothetical protein